MASVVRWLPIALVAGVVLATATASPAAATSLGATTWGVNPPGGVGESCFAGTPCHFTPKEVSGFSGVTAVSAGTNQNLALLSDGTVWAWGRLSDHAPFGPKAVSGLSGVTAVSVGGEGGLALLEDGTVSAFGSDEPVVPVSGLSNVTAISAGGNFNLALLSDGTVMAWGMNDSGQLGIGTIEGPEICGYINGEPLYCSRNLVLASIRHQRDVRVVPA